MRKTIFAAAAVVLMAGTGIANAQYSTREGAETGAAVGGDVLGVPGAIVGGVIGGAVGAANEPFDRRNDRRYRDRDGTVGYSERTCWYEFGNRVCEYR